MLPQYDREFDRKLGMALIKIMTSLAYTIVYVGILAFIGFVLWVQNEIPAAIATVVLMVIFVVVRNHTREKYKLGKKYNKVEHGA